jgi:muramoyltetrapeptide carboxypeptidase LdcA involved in peptidoglycan recycling
LAFATRTVDMAETILGHMGFTVDYGKNARDISDDGWSAGTPEARAQDFMEAFLDPEVDCVMSAVGGSTSRELIPFLDPEALREHPKPFIGRSDNTFLNAFLLDSVGLTSYNGVAFLSQFGEPEPMAETVASTQQVLLGDDPVRYRSSATHTVGVRPWEHYAQHEKGALQRTNSDTDRWLGSGVARGPLVGGEVGIVADLVEAGMIDLAGSVLWLDVGHDAPNWFGERVERIVRAAGGAVPSGFLVSHNPWIDARRWDDEVARAVRSFALPSDVPVLIGGDVGHYQPAWLLPYGDEVVLDSSSGLTWPRPGRSGEDPTRTETKMSQTERERHVVEVLGELLGARDLSTDDDFFDRGGHSLLVIRAIAVLNERHGVKVTARSFIADSRIGAIAGSATSD